MQFRRVLAVVPFLLSAGYASAAIPESVTTAITAAGTDAAVVGAAVLVVLIGIKAFKMVRSAM